MKPHHLTNYYKWVRVLEYDPETGNHHEISRDSLPPEEREPRPGFYIEKEGHFYGVRTSAHGPVYLHDTAQIPLKAGTHRAELLCQGDAREFVLWYANTKLEVVRYQANIQEEIDPYGPESGDFFHYLAQSIGNEQFHKHYSTPDA